RAVGAGSAQTSQLAALADRPALADRGGEALKGSEDPRLPRHNMRVLFFVEGHTDIRFVVGLSEICDLTLLAPARAFRESGLDERLRESGAAVQVRTIEGGRL